MTGYEAKVVECTKELTARERIAIKDTTNAIALDEATNAGEVEIDYAFHAVLSIHNEKSEDKDYEKYVIVDHNGQKYVTGSKSFYSAMCEIVNEMAGSDEDYALIAYKVPSKNYKGKDFITCSIK